MTTKLEKGRTMDVRSITAAVTAVAAVAAGLGASAAAGDAPQNIVYTRSAAEQDHPRAQEVYVMDADGSDVERLTENEREDGFASLSPDGTRIAFSRRLHRQFDLFVMDADGSDVERLTRTAKADEVLPAWSPDGRALALTVTTPAGDGWQSDVYRMSLRNGRMRRLTFTPVAKEFAPDWSPDGELIAFTKQVEKRHRYGIATVTPQGEEPSWLVINPRSGDGYTDVNPSWSPDSQWVAFSRDHGDDPYVDIYKVSRDGEEVIPVTQLFELAENPVWGADDRILFMHDEGLAVVPADGGEVETLTPVMTGLPYWWPDW
jgi:Tol biopolymer transport system component